MKVYRSMLFFIFLNISNFLSAQYQFSGYVDNTTWKNDVYLSLVEDYRKTHGIHTEQIIQKVTPDSTGYFMFSGDNLPLQNCIYKIIVENCFKTNDGLVHLNGRCSNSKEILFIANNNDKLAVPFSYDKEMFCKINSTNQRSRSIL